VNARPHFSDAGLPAEAAAAPGIVTFRGVFPIEFLAKETPMGGASDESAPTGIGHNSGADPLMGMTAKQIWIDCVWLSKEKTVTKIMLLCIGRFFDDNARSSSMSYAQVARECSLHESTPKKIAAEVRDRWLRIGVGKGFQVPGKGPQNLYHGVSPPELVEELRERKRKGAKVERDSDIEVAVERAASGVAQNDPAHAAGSPRSTEVATDDPATGRTGVAQDDRGRPGVPAGSPRATRTPITPIEDSLSSACADDARATEDLLSGIDPPQGGAPYRRSRPAKKVAASADLDAAVEAYNEAADRHGFSRCEVLTPPRAKRLDRRLTDIGGVEAFKLALTAIPRDNFLMGRVTPRDGGDSFRLTIDRLLQTDGKMGDVLAKLVDAASAGPTRPAHDDVAAAWAQVREEEGRT
jgi:hypothetical protein